MLEQPSTQAPFIRLQIQRAANPIASQPLGDRLQEQIDTGARLRGHPDAARQSGRIPLDSRRLLGEQIDLVVDLQTRDLVAADLGEHLLHVGHETGTMRCRCLHDMEQQRGIARLLEGRAERRHQLMRKPADEADRIGDEHPSAVGKGEPAQGRVQGCKELIGLEDTGLGQAVEECRLARVGIAHKREHRQLGLVACLAPLSALHLDAIQAPIKHGHPLGEEPTVGLELGLAGSAQTDTALLALQVGPSAHEPRGHVLELRKLDLQLAFEGACTLREDVENQARAIHDAALDEALEIALLAGRERMVEDHQLRFRARDQRDQFVALAGSDKEFRVGRRARAPQDADDLRARGNRQAPKLLALVGLGGRADIQVHQNSALAGARALKHGNLLRGDEDPRAGRLRLPRDHVLPGSGSAPSAGGSLTFLAGTTVDIACL